MTPHYCPVEKTNISFDDECNWCGMKEPAQVIKISDRLIWASWAFVTVIIITLLGGAAFIIGNSL